ncbi:hypothetical protein KVP10_20145 [Candidimonas humi]|jgi:hypothetical protein|uniref:Uncharacterized protein n=1 Tax=Candidimonas humi TaxID=683355 RepID=A0ABV8P459_9BURK|nr:hypothetical protein [Candidimonas humi]MBV6307209.1 hypothetical protein [Candidimonas humi]
MNLPELVALFFHPQGKGGKTILVDVGPHLLEAAKRTGDYELRTLVPPASVQALAVNGAQFHLSRQGAIHVWLAGKLVVAEAEADCVRYRARKLDPAELEYLNAYMVAIGRRWDDPDQPGMPQAVASSKEAPASIQDRLVQGLYKFVARSLLRP